MASLVSHNIGVDILHLPRLVSLLSRRPVHHFARRILTPTELSDFQKLPPPSANLTPTEIPPTTIRFLATRWAAKEAAYKASQSLIFTTEKKWMGWKNFEISHGSRGEPLLTIRDEERVLGMGKISVSHDGEYVIAMAMVPESF